MYICILFYLSIWGNEVFFWGGMGGGGMGL